MTGIDPAFVPTDAAVIGAACVRCDDAIGEEQLLETDGDQYHRRCALREYDGAFDDVPARICPQCDTASRWRLAQFSSDAKRYCPNCGAVFQTTIDTEWWSNHD
jgi:hypothetical protein